MSGRITESFLELLRSGLWQTEPDHSLLKGFSEKEWRSLWLMARKQTVQGLVYYGINLLPKDCLPPIMTLASWMVEIERIHQENTKIDSVIAELSEWWKSSDMLAVVMKGSTVAELYPDPSLRISGDIDLYFPNESDWNSAISIAKEHGCTPEFDSDGDVHYAYKKVIVEHHRTSSELSSRQSLSKLESLEEYQEWRNMKKLAPLPNLLLLNTHILKHAMVAGIGLRQFCDIAMAYKTYFADNQNRELAEEYKSAISSLGLEKWTRLLHSFLVDHLGLSNNDLPFPLNEKLDSAWLMAEVMKDGNFGEQQKNDSMIKKILHKFLFSVGFAPREYFARMFSLVLGRSKLTFGKDI
ncbi:MAG: nucleotidyltransferase family protein [Bacteroidales bacterium]|nr:nucleotidyltransferase family protein [Bacteroidales bacterium]